MAILCSGCGRQLPRIPIRGKLPVLCAACQKLGDRALYGEGAPPSSEPPASTDVPPTTFRAPPGSWAPPAPSRPSQTPPPARASVSPPRPSQAPAASAPVNPGVPRPGASVAPPPTQGAPRPRAVPSAIPAAPPAPRIDHAPRPSPPRPGGTDEIETLSTGEMEALSMPDDEVVLSTGDFEPVEPQKR